MARWSEYFQKLLNDPWDIEPKVVENIGKRSVNTALDEKPTMNEVVRRSRDSKMEKHPVETEFLQKYGNTGEPICLTDYTDCSSKYGRKARYHKPGRMPTYSPSTKQGDRTEYGNYRGISLISAAGKIIAIHLNRPVA